MSHSRSVATSACVPARVLVVEDQGMFRAFLEQWIGGLPGFALVAAERSGEEALARVTPEGPDVLVVDLNLPGIDGLACARAARQVRPQLRTLVLSSLTDPLAITRVRESGVEGYVEKDAPPAELTEALAAVAAGRGYFSQKFREVLARDGVRAEAVGKILSRREQEVLAHVIAGRTSREIGELIGVSARTVEFHRGNLMAKLGATKPGELAALAARAGLGGTDAS